MFSFVCHWENGTVVNTNMVVKSHGRAWLMVRPLTGLLAKRPHHKHVDDAPRSPQIERRELVTRSHSAVNASADACNVRREIAGLIARPWSIVAASQSDGPVRRSNSAASDFNDKRLHARSRPLDQRRRSIGW